MSDELLSSETKPDAALLEDARAAMAAMGGQVRQMAAMSYPAPLYNDLTQRVADRTVSLDATFDWLQDQCLDTELAAPSRSAFYRFAEKFLTQFKLARHARCRASSEMIGAAVAGGDPDEEILRLARQISQSLSDLMFDLGDLRDADPALITAITGGLKRVADIRNNKEYKDSRLQLMSQKLTEMKAEFESEKKMAVEAAAKVAETGGGGADVVETIKKALGITASPAKGGARA